MHRPRQSPAALPGRRCILIDLPFWASSAVPNIGDADSHVLQRWLQRGTGVTRCDKNGIKPAATVRLSVPARVRARRYHD